jgi:uncharacterized RmlC-like cupin family protein
VIQQGLLETRRVWSINSENVCSCVCTLMVIHLKVENSSQTHVHRPHHTKRYGIESEAWGLLQRCHVSSLHSY